MDSLTKLGVLAAENNVSFQELCVYALNEEPVEAEKDATEKEDEKSKEVKKTTSQEKTSELPMEPEQLKALCAQANSGYIQVDLKKLVASVLNEAHKNDVSAQCLLGMIYQTGLGVIQDERKAAEWFGKAAAQGHVNAQYKFDPSYGANDIKELREQKMQKCHIEPAAQGHEDAWFNLAIEYDCVPESRDIIQKNLQHYRKQAGKGDSQAQNLLGFMCRFLNTTKDLSGEYGFNSARQLFESAAEAGCTAADYQLGQMHKLAQGVQKDLNKAFTYYQKAADRGHLFALKKGSQYVFQRYCGHKRRKQGVLLLGASSSTSRR